MDRYKNLIVNINFFLVHHYMNYLQFWFCQYTCFGPQFNFRVKLSTFKIFNPHNWKSLSHTNFSVFPWVKSFSLVFILLFNDTLMKSLFVNLVTKHVKISYIIISSNFTPHIRLTLILSLFTLCIREVKLMLISPKCHVLSPQNAHSFLNFSFQN